MSIYIVELLLILNVHEIFVAGLLNCSKRTSKPRGLIPEHQYPGHRMVCQDPAKINFKEGKIERVNRNVARVLVYLYNQMPSWRPPIALNHIQMI
jgi:hypothetical protein